MPQSILGRSVTQHMERGLGGNNQNPSMACFRWSTFPGVVDRHDWFLAIEFQYFYRAKLRTTSLASVVNGVLRVCQPLRARSDAVTHGQPGYRYSLPHLMRGSNWKTTAAASWKSGLWVFVTGGQIVSEPRQMVYSLRRVGDPSNNNRGEELSP